MQLRKLLAVLIWHRHNMQMIHWNVIGKHFKDVHITCDTYGYTLMNHIDKIAEIMKALDLNVSLPTLIDAIKIIEDDDLKHPLIVSQSMKAREAWEMVITIFDDLIATCDSCYESLTKDIQSEIDSMVYYYRIEGSYKCKATLRHPDDDEHSNREKYDHKIDEDDSTHEEEDHSENDDDNHPDY